MRNFASCGRLSIKKGAGHGGSHARSYLSRRPDCCDSGDSILLRPSLASWRGRWKTSRRWREAISRRASCNGRPSCSARFRDCALFGVADIRSHDWPRRHIGGADLARYVRRTCDPVGPLSIIQAVVGFGLGGYIAGHTRTSTSPAAVEETEHVDGAHGLGTWALAVVMGAILAALIGAATINRTSSMRGPAQASAAEPLLSYELDRLFRAGRARPTSISAPSAPRLAVSCHHLEPQRPERGRPHLSHSAGRSADRPCRRRRGTQGRQRHCQRQDSHCTVTASTIILAFSVATAILLGAVAAWGAAAVGGRHRDGGPLPHWMERSRRSIDGGRRCCRSAVSSPSPRSSRGEGGVRGGC